ncbi:MAG: SDR family oxidoreductase, partial [Bacteroidales bacterium]|nr:SDR family oxidoreductase [Bacteroidales bacterium]
MINPLELTGKQILVAGALSETGQAIVSQLKQLGARVVIIDKIGEKPVEKERVLKGKIKDFYDFDIYENSDIEFNIERIIKECGVLNGFVYCAGIGGVRPISLTKYAFISEMMNANLLSFIEIVRCITKKNRFSDGGSIVALSSVSSIKGLKSKTAYCASKAALDASVRCMAAELSDRRIRVNSILKGWVLSDMKNDFIISNMDLNEMNDLKKQLLGITEPVEVANTVAFLLSDA